ncbi:Golgi phosphoprotein 3 [Martensiomyces pterosporus]|nr:Golgi phosphoprotein 3 [Martensiomyces pterosporus]
MSEGLSRRRVGTPRETDEDGDSRTVSPSLSSPALNRAGPASADEVKSDKAPLLTLMEETLLMGLKDQEGYLSFWNDSLSYVLRGCMLMELALRRRIRISKDAFTGMTSLSDRPIELISTRPTGEVLLDEALKVIKGSETPRSVASWMDLLSGETWNIAKAGYQLKQVRERLAKGLVDKGILRTEKRNFLLFDMATHPVQDPRAKDEVILRIFDTLNLPRSAAVPTRTARSSGTASPSNGINSATYSRYGVGQGIGGQAGNLKLAPINNTRYYKGEEDRRFALLRRVCLVSSACAGSVLENPLIHMDMETRDRAVARAEDLMDVYGHWPYKKYSPLYTQDIDTGEAGDLMVEEVVAAVICVLRKMDKLI